MLISKEAAFCNIVVFGFLAMFALVSCILTSCDNSRRLPAEDATSEAILHLEPAKSTPTPPGDMAKILPAIFFIVFCVCAWLVMIFTICYFDPRRNRVDPRQTEFFQRRTNLPVQHVGQVSIIYRGARGEEDLDLHDDNVDVHM